MGPGGLLKRLWLKVEPPISAAEQERQAKVIRPVYWVGLALSASVGLLQVLSLGGHGIDEALPSIITVGYMLACLPLMRAGRERSAGLVILFSSALINSAAMARTGGILSSAAPTYQVLIIAGGLVLGPHLVAPITAISLAVFSGILFGQAKGWVACPVDLPHAQVAYLTDAGLLIASGVVVYFAARALRERAGFNESVVLALPGLVTLFDLERHEHSWSSRRIVEDLGWDAGELGPTPMSVILHPEDRAQLPAWMARWAERKDGEVVRTDFRLAQKNGGWRVFEARETVFQRGPHGEPRQILGYYEDVTERRRAEENLDRSQRLRSLDQLAGGVAHDFNNVLAPIVGHAELIRRGLPEGDERAQAAESILRSAGRARELTRRMLGLSRHSALELRPVDLNEVVGAFLPLLQRSLRAGLPLGFEPHRGPLPVMADASQLERALLNLALNAQDAVEGDGDLRVITDREDGWAVLRFEDPGPGMSPDVRARAFEPFFTTKEPGQGTGLGLSSVHAIVQAHGGRTDLESEPGHGARFILRFPLRQEAPAAAAAPSGPWPGTLLLAEDEEDLRVLLQRQLQALGWRVLSSGSGDGALAVAEAEPGPIQLLVTDIRLPGLRGPELSRQLRAKRPGVRTAYMSGFADASEVDGPLLAKPFSLAQLKTLIEDLRPKA
jgi:PAS domain S-box-containing protein